MISADHTQVERLISNLLSNAIKYTAAGTVKVRVAMADAIGWVQLVVEDTGLGIPAEIFPTSSTGSIASGTRAPPFRVWVSA